jgi:hypothetical protein
LVDAAADGFDDFAREAAHAVGDGVFGRGDGETYVFQEDGDALDGLGAERALGRGELEGVDNFVGEGVWGQGVGDFGFFDGFGGWVVRFAEAVVMLAWLYG